MSIREFAAHLGVHERLVSKWEAGGSRVRPRPVNQAALDTSLARCDAAVHARFASFLAPAAEPDLLAVPEVMSERELIMAAAHEASEHAAKAESTNVGTTTLAQLDADVRRIAREYALAAPASMTVEMLRVRRRVYRLLDGHQKPVDTSHLYLLAGTLSGLLANASTDLGYLDAAGEQIRAAWAYAELSGNNGLRAWTRGMHALIENWSDRPRNAIQLARSGAEFAQSGTATVRLLNIEARVWARLGSESDVDRCLRQAESCTDARVDDLHDDVGGVFGFAAPKAAYYAGATYVQLGRADPALAATERAIALYEAGPAARRSYGTESLARVDNATAHLLNGGLDAAADALRPVLALPEDRRIAQLGERLIGIRRRIAAPGYRDAVEARGLDEQIEDFCAS
nr:XRE family transcriptional regulator [Nocardia camponoti]